MFPIIGISGKYGAGKDTVAAFIKEMHPEYQLEAFAVNVKKIVSILTGTSYEEQFTRDGKAKIPRGFDQTLGRYQQLVGETMRNIFNDEVWVHSVLNKHVKMIITDVRYKSEVKAIEAAGGIVIRIDRPNQGEEFSQGRDPNHSSEIDLDDWPFKYRIVNDGTLEELKQQISSLIVLISQ